MSKFIIKNVRFFFNILFVSSFLFFLYHIFLIANNMFRCYINDNYSTIFDIFSLYMLFNFIVLVVIGYAIESLDKIDLETIDLRHEILDAYKTITNKN